MNSYYARLLLGWELGTPFEQHLVAAVQQADWSELTKLAAGWPDLVSTFLLPLAELELLAAAS